MKIFSPRYHIINADSRISYSEDGPEPCPTEFCNYDTLSFDNHEYEKSVRSWLNNRKKVAIPDEYEIKISEVAYHIYTTVDFNFWLSQQHYYKIINPITGIPIDSLTDRLELSELDDKIKLSLVDGKPDWIRQKRGFGRINTPQTLPKY